MKTLPLAAALALAFLICSPAQAQYKGSRDYFPKNNPIPGTGAKPAAPQAPDKQAPATPQSPKFKDLSVNAQFYFHSDTNRAYAWTKLTATTARNSKNGVTATINAETLVQR